MEKGCNFDEIFNIFFKFVANRFIKGKIFEEGESIFLFSWSWMQMDKLVRCIGEIICNRERSWGRGQMVGNDTVRGNGLTEILPICRE